MDWDNEDKMILVAFYIGSWTWEEFFAAREQANHALDTVDHPVDIIHDWSQTSHFPPNILGNAKNLIPRMHPRTALNVHVGVNPYFLTMWQLFNRVYTAVAGEKKFLFADTLEEARRKLAAEKQREE
jgi:hypothetical protein